MSSRRAAAGAGAGAAREFDVVMFAASSFTGIRAVEHVKRQQNRSLRGLSIAIAGRNEEKLRQVNEEAGTDLPIITADVQDQSSLVAMTARCKVLLTFAGPYTLYGMPVVDACAATKTHYVDITGEPNFIRATVEKYHEQAVRDGVYFLSAAGYDSVPVELCAGILNRYSSDHGIDLQHIDCGWSVRTATNGMPFSGGTLASAFAAFEHIQPEDSKSLSLVPDNLLSSGGGGRDSFRPPGGFPNHGICPRVSRTFGGWSHMWVMAGINQKVVRKSLLLLGKRNVSYSEFLRSSSLLRALATTLALCSVVLLFVPVLGGILRWLFLPKPGQGPSRETEKQHYVIFGAGYSKPRGGDDVATCVRAKVVLPWGAYAGSAVLALETAAALALDELNPEARVEGSGWCGGGVVTPGAAVGDALVRRLRHSQITCSVTGENSWRDEDMEMV